MTQEVLEAGAEPRAPRPWLAWTVGVVALVLLTLANVAIIAEFTTRTIESERLVAAVEASESAMKATQDRFSEVLADVDTQTLTDAQRKELLAALSDVASEGQSAIAAAGEGVAAVDVLPWHRNVVDAQEAYLAHNAAWIAYMGAAAEDPGEWFRPQQEVNDTFADAKVPLVEAVPLFDIFQVVPRIETIYVTGSGDSGDGQSA